MNKPPAYQHYAAIWLADTAPFSWAAQGVYQRLLDHEWLNGPLPNDDVLLARIAGGSLKSFRRVWSEIRSKFPLGDDGLLYNPRLEHEREVQMGYRHMQSLKGLASARARTSHGSGSVEPSLRPGSHSVPTGGQPSSSSSPSSPSTEISVESRREGRRSAPQPLSELLKDTAQVGVHRFRRVQPHEAP